MSIVKFGSLLAILSLAATAARGGQPAEKRKIVLVIHGGAGARPRSEMSSSLQSQYETALKDALKAGYAALQRPDGTSLDAVEAAIKVMEDSPLFNAGKGAVFTHEGRIELDASIMEGKEKKAGAVAGVSRIKNPISGARAVMEKSKHVMMVGDGADRFAISVGLKEANPVEFWTEKRWKQLLEELEKEEKENKGAKVLGKAPSRNHFGTVGAVALDRDGNLAAGTSTGGISNKRYGRVGDSPIIGAGTYAENGVCGVSCTGHGEVFIRYAVAHEVVATMRLGKEPSVAAAARSVLAKLPKEPDGVGGLIALDSQGQVAMEFDTEGMYRGWIDDRGVAEVSIYK